MEELEKQTQTETVMAVEQEQKKDLSLDDFPRLEDLIKSEQEIKPEVKLQGLKSAEPTTQFEDRPFTLKKDEKKKFVKKRLKLITGVYITIATLLLGFVGVNIATLAVLNKKIDNNVKTISEETIRIEENSTSLPDNPLTGTIEITLNQPRDYNDDNHSLTLLDKLTILFRSMFG